MSDFQINEDSGYYELRSITPLAYPGALSISNLNLPSGVRLFVQTWEGGAAISPLTAVTSGYSRTFSLNSRASVVVYIKPDEDVNGADLQLSFDVTRSRSGFSSKTTFQRDFDIISVEDSPSALLLSSGVVTEGGQPIEIGILTGTDADNHPALTYTLVFDPTGQLSINYNRLMANGGLDYEALEATGLYSKDGQGRIEIPIVVRVTDPDGNFNDFNRTIYVTDVAENLQTSGTTGDDFTRGTLLDDVIGGGIGDDHLFGGQGNDRLNGDRGDDYVAGQSGDDIVHGGAGNDIVRGGAGSDTVFGNAGDDVAYGGSGNDKVFGGTGDDIIFGGAGNDRLDGGAGRDYLRDGAGLDRLFGGDGKDVFKFVADGSRDVVHDFQDGADLLRLTYANNFASLQISDLSYGGVLVRDGNEVLIVRDSAGTLTAADLTAEDFIF